MDNNEIDHRCRYCKKTISKGRKGKIFCSRECKENHHNSEAKKKRNFTPKEKIIKKGRKGKHTPKGYNP